MVVLVHLPQDTERTIILYLNKKETLGGRLNEKCIKWKNQKTSSKTQKNKEKEKKEKMIDLQNGRRR